jgi:putative hemolysin
MKRKYLFFIFLSFTVILTACEKKTPTPNAGLANPASVYCQENNGTLEIRTAEDGSQIGVCHFKDGSECEEWAYFRKECKPGDVFP